MKVKIILSVLLLTLAFNCLSINSNGFYAEEISSNAKSMVVIEQDSGRILYQKDCEKKLPMASTTKIVTALTVLNNCKNINEEVVINDKAVGIEGTSIYLRKGEKLSVKELLYGLILASGNDAATALAYHIGKDIPTFCKLMQETALKCGAKNTNFVNPHGLDEDGHYTTAIDLAKITSIALKNDDFREIIETKNIRIRGSGGEDTYRYLKNKNKLLWTNPYCTGVKTGFTDNAGRCFVASATKNNLSIVTVVFNCGPMFEETNKLFDLAFDNYENVELLKPYKYLKLLGVENGKQDNVKVYTKRGFIYPLTKEEKSKVVVKINTPNFLKAPLEKEQIIGNFEIYLENNLLFTEKIYTMESVKSNRLIDNFETIIEEWIK